MARELYNWDQLRGYSIIALCNLLDKNNPISLENFIKELDSLQTLYGKEGVIGLSRRYLNIKNKI